MVISGNTANNGGGIHVDGGGGATKVSISNSLIAGNGADNYAGGTFLTNLKSITISKTVVTGNTATNLSGGGIRADINGTGAGIAIIGCQISGNTAGFGGGLLVSDGNFSPTSKIIVSATKITGNTSTNASATGGGGLYVGAGNVIITGSLIRDNTSVYDGGGIEAKGFASLTISKSTISGNQTTVISQNAGGGGPFPRRLRLAPSSQDHRLADYRQSYPSRWWRAFRR